MAHKNFHTKPSAMCVCMYTDFFALVQIWINYNTKPVWYNKWSVIVPVSKCVWMDLFISVMEVINLELVVDRDFLLFVSGSVWAQWDQRQCTSRYLGEEPCQPYHAEKSHTPWAWCGSLHVWQWTGRQELIVFF